MIFIIHNATSEQTEEAKALLQEQRNNAYNLLTEAIIEMKEDNVRLGISLVKEKVLMLNPDFDDKELGFSNWSCLINEAQNEGLIKVSGKGEGLILDVAQPVKEKIDQEKAFEMLLRSTKRM